MELYEIAQQIWNEYEKIFSGEFLELIRAHEERDLTQIERERYEYLRGKGDGLRAAHGHLTDQMKGHYLGDAE
jgi:hypothetical protein